MTAPIPMATVDSVWLGLDAPEHLMTVTAVLWLDHPLDRDRLAEVVRHRLLDRYPTFSMRIQPSTTALRPPTWVDDDDFDLDRHLVEAGTCADERALADMVGDLLATPLDLAHSPWLFHLVEMPSADDDPFGALVAQMHHCLADGIALADVLVSLTDNTRRANPAQPQPGAEATSAATPALKGRSPVSTALLGWELARTAVTLLVGARDPRTRLRGRPGVDKTAAWSTPFDLSVIKRVAAEADATVNDVLLAVVAGGLRAYLLESGEPARDLPVFIPVDLRGGAPVPATLGNRFGIVFVRLPVAEPNPVARVRAVRERMDRVKVGAQAMSTFAMLGIVGALPQWGHRLAVRLLGASSAAIVTNVIGPPRPVYLAGTRLKRAAFWVPQTGSIGLGLSILSYAGEVSLGIAADRNVVADPARLATLLDAELHELAKRILAVDETSVVLEAVPFDSPIAVALTTEVQQEYVSRYGGHDETPIDPSEFAAPEGTFLVARAGPTLIGCAGLRRHDEGAMEIKRMFIRIEHRGRGYARKLLAALEDTARASGARRVVLETGLAQPEAIALYTSAGYAPIDGFGHYKDTAVARSFARDL